MGGRNTMRHNLIITSLLIVFIIMISSISIHVSAQQGDKRPRWYRYGPYNPDLEKYGIIGNITNFIVNRIFLTFGLVMIGTGKAPRHIFADPNTVEIDYFGNTTVDIVWGNPTKDNYSKFFELTKSNKKR